MTRHPYKNVKLYPDIEPITSPLTYNDHYAQGEFISEIEGQLISETRSFCERMTNLSIENDFSRKCMQYANHITSRSSYEVCDGMKIVDLIWDVLWECFRNMESVREVKPILMVARGLCNFQYFLSRFVEDRSQLYVLFDIFSSCSSQETMDLILQIFEKLTTSDHEIRGEIIDFAKHDANFRAYLIGNIEVTTNVIVNLAGLFLEYLSDDSEFNQELLHMVMERCQKYPIYDEDQCISTLRFFSRLNYWKLVIDKNDDFMQLLSEIREVILESENLYILDLYISVLDKYTSHLVDHLTTAEIVHRVIIDNVPWKMILAGLESDLDMTPVVQFLSRCVLCDLDIFAVLSMYSGNEEQIFGLLYERLYTAVVSEKMFLLLLIFVFNSKALYGFTVPENDVEEFQDICLALADGIPEDNDTVKALAVSLCDIIEM